MSGDANHSGGARSTRAAEALTGLVTDYGETRGAVDDRGEDPAVRLRIAVTALEVTASSVRAAGETPSARRPPCWATSTAPTLTTREPPARSDARGAQVDRLA